MDPVTLADIFVDEIYSVCENDENPYDEFDCLVKYRERLTKDCPMEVKYGVEICKRSDKEVVLKEALRFLDEFLVEYARENFALCEKRVKGKYTRLACLQFSVDILSEVYKITGAEELKEQLDKANKLLEEWISKHFS